MLNGTQHQIMEATLQFMLEGIVEDVTKADALAGLKATKDEALYEAQHSHFAALGILESLDAIRRIYQHPCPQNRAVGSQYVGQETGLAVWRDPISKRICKEPLGLLGLTATNDDTAEPVTAQDVWAYIDAAIAEQQERIAAQPDVAVEPTVVQQSVPVASPRLFVADTQNLLEQARQLMQERRRLEAIVIFDQLIEANANHAPYYYERGRLLAASGQRSFALKDFNRAIELGQRHAQIFVERGYTRENFGDSLGALSDYNYALTLEPQHAFTLSQRAGLYCLQQKFAQGLQDYQTSLSIKEDAATYRNRGTWLAMLQRYEEALADFNDSLRLQPNQPDVDAMRREAAVQLEKLEAAPVNATCLTM